MGLGHGVMDHPYIIADSKIMQDIIIIFYGIYIIIILCVSSFCLKDAQWLCTVRDCGKFTVKMDICVCLHV